MESKLDECLKIKNGFITPEIIQGQIEALDKMAQCYATSHSQISTNTSDLLIQIPDLQGYFAKQYIFSDAKDKFSDDQNIEDQELNKFHDALDYQLEEYHQLNNEYPNQ